MVMTVVESTRRCQPIELYKALGQILFNKELNWTQLLLEPNWTLRPI